MEITSIKHNSIYFNNFGLHDYQKPTILPQLEWFATLSEAQEFSKTLLNKNDMFKKDDYIVITKSQYPNDVSFPINYCYKQKCDNNYLSVYLDAQENGNGCGILKFDTYKNSFNWRYATKEEIAEYDKLGKPFDVTTLHKKEELKVGDWVVTDMMNADSYHKDKAYKVIEIDNDYPLQPCFKITESDDSKAYSWCYPYSDKKSVRKALPHEIPNQKIIKEELLEEAKRRYTIGCMYKSTTSPSIYQLKSELEIDKYGNICDADRTCHVYLNNKWAEIIYENSDSENLLIANPISIEKCIKICDIFDEISNKLDLSLRDEKEINYFSPFII